MLTHSDRIFDSVLEQILQLSNIHWLTFATQCLPACLPVYPAYIFYVVTECTCRSRWPRAPRRGSRAACLLGLRVQIPPGAWMSVSC